MRLGFRTSGVTLLFYLLLVLTASGQQPRHYRYVPGAGTSKTDVLVKDNSLTINYYLPEFNLDNITNESGTFYRIGIPGHTPSPETGKPELPQFSRIIEIPSGRSAVIKISDVKTIRMKPSSRKIDGLLYPAQESESKDQRIKKQPFVMDKGAYALKTFFRTDTVKIEPLGKARGRNLANLVISPVSYNPYKNTLEVITSMKIDIQFVVPENVSGKTLFPESRLYSGLLEKGVLNYYPADFINGYSDKPVRMIILTDTSFKKTLQPYILWKKQKGFKIDILYKGTAYAGNDYLTIKNSIAKIYNSSTVDNPPPEFLLIVGNVSKIPSYENGTLSDMYYGEFDGNGDYIPEMFVGRIPVSTAKELKGVLDKIIQYEKFSFLPAYKFYSNGLITTGDDASNAMFMNGQVKYAISYYLNPANKINEFHFYDIQPWKNPKDSIIKLINNKGISFINYTGHGDPYGWLGLGFKVSDTASLKNTDMYPFIISNACETSAFSINSLGNVLLNVARKGAVGFIGCSDNSYWDEDFYWAVGVGTPSSDPKYETTGLGALDRLFHTHSEKPSEWFYNMGMINYAGNMAVSASTSSRKKYYWEHYNLVGDPSVIPVIGTPDVFNISIPDTLPNGIKSFSFAGDAFAYAAVSHFDTLWDASFISPSGTVTLDLPGISNDSSLFIITGQNRKPLIKKVKIGNIKKEFLNLNKAEINDIAGNNNGKADFGETVYLKINVGNLGKTAANNLRAIISSTSPMISIVNDSAFIGTLGSLSETTITDKLQIKISDNVPDLGVATINITLKDNSTIKSYKTDISLHAPNLEIMNYTIDDKSLGDGDLIADPGEIFNLKFRVQNSGSSNTSGTLNVTSHTSELTVLEPAKGSGLIQQSKITEIPVMVRLTPSTPFGTTISLSSLLDCNPYFINKDYSFRVGRIQESFEYSTFKMFPWLNRSTKSWTITELNSFDGIASARSGAISHNESTSLVIYTYYPAADSIKFYYDVSSEKNYDFLIFKLNDAELLKKSGETLWQKAALPVPAGRNKMEWIYKKDQSVSSGSDCAMIDMIDFAGQGTVTFIARDIAMARIVSPVNKEELEREPVILKVLNLGPDTIKGFNMAYTVNNNLPVIQHFDISLMPFGDSVTINFATSANLSRYGKYNISAYGINNNDDYPRNDTLKVSVMNNMLDGPLQVWPNPFTDQINIVLNSEAAGKARIMLVDLAGRIIAVKEKDIPAGTSTAELTNLNIPVAAYNLRIEFPGYSKTIHLVKIKH